MSKGRVAVVMCNAYQHQQNGKPGWFAGSANVTAHWHDLWLGNDTVAEVRDAVNHRDLGRFVGSVTITVHLHDVAVLILTPVGTEAGV